MRETALSFEPAPTVQMESTATYSLQLAPGAKRTIFVTVSSRGLLPESTQSFFKGLAALHRERRSATRAMAAVETSNSVLNEILCRSMADLRMLMTATPDGPYPYAGIPWYSTSFGRDGIITALQMLWMDPAVAAGVLKRLARYQANVEDARSDAEPGQDPARDAGRRDGGAGRDTVRPLLRQRRRDPAVRHARRPLRAAHRRLRVHPARCGRRSSVR